MKSVLLLALAVTGTAFAAGPSWDSTGNGQLSGAYKFRQVQYFSDGAGNIGQQIAYFGTITFNGTGGYTLSGSNTLLNTGGTLGIPASGTYSVAASGYGFLSNPLTIGGSLYFLVSNHILIGSSTENGGSNGTFVNDLFIATPATPTLTSSGFNGAYTVAGYLPGNGTAGVAADLTFQISPNGSGSAGAVTVSGYGGADGTSALKQSTAGLAYSFSQGVGSLNFPTFGAAPLYTGPENIYVSPDTNFVFGGSPTGYDMFVGVRNLASGTPALASGLYYEVGLDEDESQLASNQQANIDTYYGVFNTFSGNILGHERINYAGSGIEGSAYTTTYPTGSYTGLANVGQLDPSATVQYTVGTNGIRIGFGIGPWLGIEVAFPVTAPTPTAGAFIDPTGIVNTASSTPFTAGITPGEFITLYNGVNLAPATTTCWTAGPPFPTTLAGVQVTISGTPAPIYCVGPQITVIVPYEVSSSPIASIQVSYNNTVSNIATAFVYKTAPGVFTVPSGGLGPAAAQHGNYALITTANPALPGETIVIYLSGLGSVFSVNGVPATDGTATGPNGDTIVSNIAIDVGGFGSTSVIYAGLTPSTAGLYQVNFQVPISAPAGNDALAIVASGTYSSQAVLPVGHATGAPPEAAPGAARRILPRLANHLPPSATDNRGTIRQ